jgi:hypothetical protein
VDGWRAHFRARQVAQREIDLVAPSIDGERFAGQRHACLRGA